MFKSMLSSFNISFIVNPLSAIIEIPGLSSRAVRKPLTRVSSTSDIDPTYTCDMKQIDPFGVQATKNFTVLWCLYSLHVDDCICKSEGVSMKTSLPSIIAYVVGNFALNADGSVPRTWSTAGIQSISFR